MTTNTTTTTNSELGTTRAHSSLVLSELGLSGPALEATIKAAGPCRHENRKNSLFASLPDEGQDNPFFFLAELLGPRTGDPLPCFQSLLPRRGSPHYAPWGAALELALKKCSKNLTLNDFYKFVRHSYPHPSVGAVLLKLLTTPPYDSGEYPATVEVVPGILHHLELTCMSDEGHTRSFTSPSPKEWGEAFNRGVAASVEAPSPAPAQAPAMRLLSSNIIQLSQKVIDHLRAEPGEFIFSQLLKDGGVMLQGEKAADEFFESKGEEESSPEEPLSLIAVLANSPQVPNSQSGVPDWLKEKPTSIESYVDYGAFITLRDWFPSEPCSNWMETLLSPFSKEVVQFVRDSDVSYTWLNNQVSADMASKAMVVLSSFIDKEKEVPTLVKIASWVDIESSYERENDTVPEWLLTLKGSISREMYNAYLILREFFPEEPCESWYTAFEKTYNKDRVAWLRRSQAFQYWVQDSLPPPLGAEAVRLLDEFLEKN
jgi:hypothetical protein